MKRHYQIKGDKVAGKEEEEDKGTTIPIQLSRIPVIAQPFRG